MGGTDREVEGETAGRVLPGRREIRVFERGDTEIERGRLGAGPTDTALVVELHLLRRPEERHVAPERALVENLVRPDEFREAAEREMDLKVGGPMVDRVDTPSEIVGQLVAVEQLGEG